MLTPHETIDGLALFVAAPAMHQHDLHTHDALSVIMLDEGVKTFHKEKKDHIVSAGQIAIANPGEVHGCEPAYETAWSHHTWYLNHDLVTKLAEETGFNRRPEIGQSVIDDARFHTMLLSAHKLSQNGNELDRESAAITGLTTLIKRFGDTSAFLKRAEIIKEADKRVILYKDMINAELTNQLNLSALAREAGVTRYQVIRDFKKALNLSPGEYLRARRLAHAKQSISDGSSLAEAALEAGFADQSHFSRIFKRVYGFTPREFSLAIRKKYWMIMI